MNLSIPKNERFINSTILFSLILLTFSGCTASNYGKLRSNKEATKSFESYQALPNHKYFYRGPKSKPTVIVGIHDNYELNLKLWVQIDTESEDFRKLIDIVSLQGMSVAVAPWGFNILDKDDNYVGVWYSAISGAAVVINENRQITNLQPSRTVAIGDQRK